MSVFSFCVLLPLNFTGGGHAKAEDLKQYVGSMFFTNFLRFTMANVQSGSPRLWVYCFGAYLLTGIVVRELLIEYEQFALLRHKYLLSSEPHLRTVLVTNIPRHLRSARKISSYFRNVYPDAVKDVFMCQNLIQLEKLVSQRTSILARIESELLILCRKEKKKLYEQSAIRRLFLTSRLEDCGVVNATQERLATLYDELEKLNTSIEAEQRRRRRIMKMLDRMESDNSDLDYVLASPVDASDPYQQRTLGLSSLGDKYHPDALEIASRPSMIEEEDEQQGSSGDTTFKGSLLRSRSPVVGHSSEELPAAEEIPNDDKKEKPKPSVRAKNAIRRYSRLNRETNFLGRPIHITNGHIEDHMNEVTDKAFVIMRTYTAATIAIQSMHSSKPGAMQVVTAPEPRDVLWPNIYMSKGAQRTRTYIGEFVVMLVITFYAIPVAIISLLVSENALISNSERLQQLDQASAFFSALIASVQPICIVGLQQLLPPLFMVIGRAEGITAFSDIQMQAFSRYFLFQVLNVFLVTTIAGSIFDTIAIIIENPEQAFAMLGNSLPRMSSFFITFVTIKAFLALGLELVRCVSLVQAVIRCIIFPKATLRTKRTSICALRSIDDPGWFPFHKVLAQDMLVVVVSVVFAVVAPLVLLPCGLFCLFSRILWTHHHMYIYEAVFESGGQFWPKIFRRFVFGLIIAQMTITGQFILKDARHEAYATVALMFMTYMFLRSTRARYDPTSSTLPLEVATVMDMNLAAEEEAAERRAKGLSPSSAATDSRFDHFIGPHDPFKRAYLQPALRANPRARAEQPFPPAQLGPDIQMGNTYESSGGTYQDSGATVRLQNLNQSDRRLINQWWKEQFDRAGAQRSIPVLMGTECGTLTLDGTNGAYINPVLVEKANFV